MLGNVWLCVLECNEGIYYKFPIIIIIMFVKLTKPPSRLDDFYCINNMWKQKKNTYIY